MVHTALYTQQLEVLHKVTRQAGEMAHSFQEDGFKRLANKGEGKDPFLTEADLAIDTYLREAITQTFPDHGWLSEETAVDLTCLEKEFCWVVDPIDGTQGFIDGQSTFSVSVGLVHKGIPVLGAVYAPMEGVFIIGGQGHGVKMEGVFSSECQRPSTPHILVSHREKSAGFWAGRDYGFTLEAVGSIAYKLALVAAKCADGVVSLKPKNLHDVCAGHALLLAQGGKLEEYPKKPLIYQNPSHLLTGLVGGHSKAGVAEIFSRLQARTPQSE